jgi:hypothetical protein
MDTIQFPTELREFLELLSENHVEYLLVGGYAVGYHGFPRATADMDIWIATNEKNAGRMIATLETMMSSHASQLSPLECPILPPTSAPFKLNRSSK